MSIYTTTLTSNWRRKFTSQSRLISMINFIIIGCKHLSKCFLFTHARTQIMTKFTTFCTFIINYLRRQVFIVGHRTSLFTIPRHPTIIHNSMKHNRIQGIEQTHKQEIKKKLLQLATKKQCTILHSPATAPFWWERLGISQLNSNQTIFIP